MELDKRALALAAEAAGKLSDQLLNDGSIPYTEKLKIPYLASEEAITVYLLQTGIGRIVDLNHERLTLFGAGGLHAQERRQEIDNELRRLG